MYNNSLPKLNPISGVQIHSKHKLREEEKKNSNTQCICNTGNITKHHTFLTVTILRRDLTDT